MKFEKAMLLSSPVKFIFDRAPMKNCSHAGVILALWSFSLVALIALPLHAAEVSAREVTVQLFESSSARPANFERYDLKDLDLSGIDFKKAHLSGADMFGVDLTHADLSGVDLRVARMDRTIILGARFDGANLEGVSMLRPAVFSTLADIASETVSFEGANLKGATLFGRFNGSNFRKVNLSGANLAPRDRSSFIEHIWRTEFLGVDLKDANLRGANLERVWFAFADLRGADLTGASLKNCDLSGADLRGADLTGVDVTKADFSDVKLEGAKGLDTLIGLSTIRGRNHLLVARNSPSVAH